MRPSPPHPILNPPTTTPKPHPPAQAPIAPALESATSLPLRIRIPKQAVGAVYNMNNSDGIPTRI